MKSTLFTLLFCSTLAVAAQQVNINGPRRLLPDLEMPAGFPVLAADGSRLLFSDSDANGLSLYDYATGAVTTVTTAAGAGFDASFAADGRVYYVGQQRGEHNLVYRSGHAFDPATGASAEVMPPQHGAVHLVRAMAGAAFSAGRQAMAMPATAGVSVYTEGSTVVIGRAGREQAHSPVPSHAGYLWPSLSPDGTRVAFFAAERGICVIDLDGHLLAQLGNYEFPSWLNDHYLVAQHATDDGHQFTSSQIMLLKADGSWSRELTSPSSMTMQPTAANGKLVYTTIDGRLYEMQINIVEP